MRTIIHNKTEIGYMISSADVYLRAPDVCAALGIHAVDIRSSGIDLARQSKMERPHTSPCLLGRILIPRKRTAGTMALRANRENLKEIIRKAQIDNLTNRKVDTARN